MVSQHIRSLCGVVVCQRLCVRSEHCQAGLARRRVLLGHRAAQRRQRRRSLGALLARQPVTVDGFRIHICGWTRGLGMSTSGQVGKLIFESGNQIIAGMIRAELKGRKS